MNDLLKRFMYTFAPDTTIKPESYVTLDLPQALTAIYEIGLEVIGEDEVEEDDSGGKYKLNKYLVAENRLRRQQRKAWAKVCGVAEK